MCKHGGNIVCEQGGKYRVCEHSSNIECENRVVI